MEVNRNSSHSRAPDYAVYTQYAEADYYFLKYYMKNKSLNLPISKIIKISLTVSLTLLVGHDSLPGSGRIYREEKTAHGNQQKSSTPHHPKRFFYHHFNFFLFSNTSHFDKYSHLAALNSFSCFIHFYCLIKHVLLRCRVQL